MDILGRRSISGGLVVFDRCLLETQGSYSVPAQQSLGNLKLDGGKDKHISNCRNQDRAFRAGECNATLISELAEECPRRLRYHWRGTGRSKEGAAGTGFGSQG